MIAALPMTSIAANRSNAVEKTSSLAADVNAAAEALENLKHLLSRQLSVPTQSRLPNGPDPQAGPRPGLPLPAYGMRQARVAPLLPAGSAFTADQGPRPFDIRSFLAGFALSAAMGAALYIHLAAG
jgi:hypothetical protein